MIDYAGLTKAIDLSEEQIEAAIISREETKALLDHFSTIARPAEGAFRLLLLFAQLADDEVDWLDGDLRVELVGDGQVTVVEVLTELGGGLRERALAPVALHVPLSEFIAAVDTSPFLVSPLGVASKSERRIVFAHVSPDSLRKITEPPAAVPIAEANLSDIKPPAAARRDAAPKKPTVRPADARASRPSYPDFDPTKLPGPKK